MAPVRHRIGDDDMVLGIDRRLDVVANDAAMVASGRHGPRVRIGKRDLLIGSGLQLSANLLEFPKSPAQRGQSFGQMIDAWRRGASFCTVGFLELGEIACNAFFDMSFPARQLALGVILLVRVHRPQP